jgi:hypothetical protein
MGISAEVHSDDHVFEASFDATKWFEQASDEEVVDLAKICWGGDYASDEVARFMQEHDTDVKKVFDYLALDPTMGTGDTVGFECHVDEREARVWLKKNKPALSVRIEEDAAF